jgi:peptidoglycan/xylan/chitin deacetylase (PgdA/CDA1 family)/SAM-dependent methyltransferase
MNVSIVIPAYNAAETITETLASLQAQTMQNWEAIVVNDGSSDETEAIAKQVAAKDSRIRTLSQPNQGVSAARNTGIGLANFDWLSFLDADDWLSPQYLERMTTVLAADSSLDAVHCGMRRVDAYGNTFFDTYVPELTDLFPVFARQCPLLIHACVFRKALADEVGGFDISLSNSEDWDFWQRITRTGARFGAVKEILAFYRMRPNSLSRDGNSTFANAMRVLAQGHSPDPRVPNPHPSHAEGEPQQALAKLKLQKSSWHAGLLIGSGKDARHLLKLLVNDCAPNLWPSIIAHRLFKSVLVSTCQLPAAWEKLWPSVEGRIKDFLVALEAQSQAVGLARRASTILERMVLQHSQVREPLTIGTTYAVRLEVTEPISDLCPTVGVERLYCIVEMEGTELGRLELPICDGLVASWVIKDAIAAQYAGQILGRFFEHTVKRSGNPEAEEQESKRDSLSQNPTAPAPPDQGGEIQNLHDQIDWTLFLQQIWGRPDWPLDRFYNPEVVEEAIARKRIEDNWLRVEISEELPDVEVAVPELDVVLTVGGVAIGSVSIPVEQNFVSAQALRVALTTASELELCRACVREGLLGRPLGEVISLRSRLAEAAMAQAQSPEWFASTRPAVVSTELLSPNTVVLGRRRGAMGTSASRRAILPGAVARELVEMAQVAGEPVMQIPPPGTLPERVIYAPELIERPSERPTPSSRQSASVKTRWHDRAFFETWFSTQPDPWKYTSPYEQTKYEQTLSLLPSTQIGKALELACAEGHFTVQLAPRVESLIAADISQVALDRAAERCRDLQNISFQHLDMTKDPLPGHFDLIVCSEVLYYLKDLEELKVIASQIAEALEPGGYLLMAHAHVLVDEPDKTGFDWGNPFGGKVIGETFASIPSLGLVKEIWTPLYRVQLFQRHPWQHHTPDIVKLTEQPAPIPPNQEAYVRWHGGQPRRRGKPGTVVTQRLPILMYHRVAPTGSATMNRYRVTPEAFEEQLRYLRDAGFYSVAWEDWQAAVAARRPLPGRAIAITFDDGYLDFLHYAWPLLKQYGFTATVFLVTEHVGGSNIWDAAYGEEVLPLLGWSEIRQLQDEGVEFGSHSATHSHLTALSVAEVVQEAARSKSILKRQLGMSVEIFAYPYGEFDPVIQHLIGACGYTFGLSCRSGLSQFQDELLALPRIEVMGSDSLQEFVAKLSS